MTEAKNTLVEEEVGVVTPAKMTDPKVILAFMFAGDATLTFRGSSTRYTYRIKESDLSPEDQKKGLKPRYFVSLLTGSDNENDYQYMGMISFGYDGRSPKFNLTRGSKMAKRNDFGSPLPMEAQSQPIRSFDWVFVRLLANRLPQGVEIWHEGRCSRCGRKLTDDESIANGFGPTCFELVGGIAGIQKFFVSLTPVAGLQPQTMTKYAVRPEAAAPKPATSAQIVADVVARIQPTVQPVVNKPEDLKKVLAVASGEASCASCKQAVALSTTAAYDNVVGEFCPACQKTAEALAKSQDNWTVADAASALSKRRIVNLNLKKKSSRAEVVADEPAHVLAKDPAILAMVETLKATDQDKYSMDGILGEDEAHAFWYRRFKDAPAEV